MKMKKIVSLLLAVITVFSLVQVTAFAAPLSERPFEDVPRGAYYAKAVTWARDVAHITSNQTSNFYPDNNIKRCDFVLMLYALEKRPYVDDPAAIAIVDGFGDVPETAYYYDAVCWAVHCGITGGKSDGRFHPNDFVTNSETMVFLYAAVKSKYCKNITAISTVGGRLSKLHVGKSNWAYEACSWANNKGYLSSIPDFAVNDEFLPSANTTRAMLVYLLWEMKFGTYENVIENMMAIANLEKNKTDGSKYGTSSAWCAAFASWCAKEAGLTADTDYVYNMPAADVKHPVLRSANCTSMGIQFSMNGKLYVTQEHFKEKIWSKANVIASNFVPRRGDFVIFASSSKIITHIGIVTEAYMNGNGTMTIKTIEGNTSSKVDTITYIVNMSNGSTDKSGNTAIMAAFGRVFETKLP